LRPLFLEPNKIVATLLAEIPKGVLCYGVLDFMLEIVEHVFGTVIDASVLLVRSAPTGIHDATAGLGGPTPAEAFDNEDFRAIVDCLDSRTYTGTTKSDYDNIDFLVPVRN